MVYVTSDLHGYSFERFMELLAKVHFSKEDDLYVIGDVVDRGKDGIRLLLWMMGEPNVELLLGNHELMMLSCDFVLDRITDASSDALTADGIHRLMHWTRNGGEETITGLRAISPQKRIEVFDYVREAPLYAAISVCDRDFFLSHAGLGNFREDKKISEYATDDLVWHRASPDERYFDDITVIFGHTPTAYYGRQYAGKMLVTDTWINIDTGAASGGSPMLLRLDDMTPFYMDDASSEET